MPLDPSCVSTGSAGPPEDQERPLLPCVFFSNFFFEFFVFSTTKKQAAHALREEKGKSDAKGPLAERAKKKKEGKHTKDLPTWPVFISRQQLPYVSHTRASLFFPLFFPAIGVPLARRSRWRPNVAPSFFCRRPFLLSPICSRTCCCAFSFLARASRQPTYGAGPVVAASTAKWPAKKNGLRNWASFFLIPFFFVVGSWHPGAHDMRNKMGRSEALSPPPPASFLCLVVVVIKKSI